MKIRRLVTGNDANGKSVALKTGTPPFSRNFGPYVWDELWTADTAAPDVTTDVDPGDVETVRIIPAAGTVTWRAITIQPETAPDSERPAGAGEPDAAMAGLIDTGDVFEGDTPWHVTPTIDFITVISGRIDMELDDGVHTLGPGDCVVQRATRHAWFNRYTEPCVMIGTLMTPASS
jgi:mannose-6-phosphate isomerase-like protein (cupin superfamily)